MEIFRIVVTRIPRRGCAGSLQKNLMSILDTIPETEMVDKPNGFDGKRRDCRKVSNFDQVIAVLRDED
jgi:hypothetical protein